MNVLLPDNHFAIESSDCIREICHPLYDTLKITDIIFARIYDNNQILLMSSNPYYPNFHLSSGFPALPPIPPEYLKRKSSFFLPEYFGNQLFNKFVYLTGIELGQSHPLYVLNFYSGYFELFVFLSSPDNTNTANIYLNNIDLIEKFKIFFKNETINLVVEGEKSKFSMPNHLAVPFNTADLEFHTDQSRLSFLQQIEIKSLLDSPALNLLTKRELDCLYYFAKGYTMKVIAKQLKVTPKTVEFHIANVKDKLHYRTKNELIKFISQLADKVWVEGIPED